MSVRASPPGGSRPPEDDFISKHGKRVVVIVFCFLAGDALPTIIQSGLNPRAKFYTIVIVTLPYTGSLALIFLFLTKSKEHVYGQFMLSGLILLAGFWLATSLHWGITEAEAVMVNQQMMAVNHPVGRPVVAGPQAMLNDVRILSDFYFNKFGAPLFVGGTLAAVVIAWNMAKWTEKEASSGTSE